MKSPFYTGGTKSRLNWHVSKIMLIKTSSGIGLDKVNSLLSAQSLLVINLKCFSTIITFSFMFNFYMFNIFQFSILLESYYFLIKYLIYLIHVSK